MTTRFKNALDALVHAFFNDTLAKGSCYACAVGNIVACGFGEKLKDVRTPVFSQGFNNSAWTLAFYTVNSRQTKNRENFNTPCVNRCISATGYSIKELMKIEYAFETSTRIYGESYERYSKQEIMNDQYNGLMAVLDVLCEIEGIEDPQEYKQLFQFESSCYS